MIKLNKVSLIACASGLVAAGATLGFAIGKLTNKPKYKDERIVGELIAVYNDKNMTVSGLINMTEDGPKLIPTLKNGEHISLVVRHVHTTKDINDPASPA